MASIINLDEKRLTARKPARVRRGTGQVVIFTGVRYERGAAETRGERDGGAKPVRTA